MFAPAVVQERYDRFARNEAPGRSELYGQWAAGVAADAATAAVIARIPADRRQPPLVFAVTRMLGAPLAPFPVWSRWVLRHADAVVAECAMRTLQTNEPLRCAALLPALGLIDGPLALLEVGAAAGLCLYPDRYSYRYVEESRAVLIIDPADGPSPVTLDCEVRGAVPQVRMPDIVWRAGIDLHPLDARNTGDRAWLTGLVWPGETGRAQRIEAALDLVAADPPILVAGDAADLLAEMCARAPSDATVVVTTPGVLAHVPRADRSRIIDAARTAAHWVTLDAPNLHEEWNAPIDAATWPSGGFALALDGDVLAATDPLGRWLEWHTGISGVSR